LQIARDTTPNKAIKTMYHHDPDITHIELWRIVSDKIRDRHDNMPLQQKQYLDHYTPMITERWALPIFRKACFTPESTHPTGWSTIECACCEVCFLFYV